MPPAPPPHLAVSPWFYAAFLAGVAVMLLLDLGVFNKKAHAPGFKESLGWVTVWSSLAIAFGGLVAVQHGATAALDYYTGWLIEQSLSIDNLFVFVVVFRALKVPSHLQHRVLYWGVLSAVALRAAMIFGGAILVERFAWILYVFGVFLVFTAVRMLVGKGDDPTAEESRVLQWLRGRVRTTGFHGQQFLVREAGRWHATPLLLALVLVEITDVIFAVDSIPAVFAVTTDPFLVFTS
ncbi:MAG: TerC/Alx family metal homeostasis membrane protein, partial [Planctomycetota bacterium]